MKTITINTAKELKCFISKNRNNIKQINNLEINGIYPIIEVNNNNAWYYDINSQSDKIISSPFIINF